jgi:hypothetical protein
VPPKRSPARYLWAVLIARIYEVFPLRCPLCAGQMRLIAFITEGAQIRKILEHIGVDSQPPRIAPARGPPMWEDCDAQTHDAVQIESDWGTGWDLAAQATPDQVAAQMRRSSVALRVAHPLRRKLLSRTGLVRGEPVNWCVAARFSR